MTNAKTNETKWRSADGRFAVRLTHLTVGWRLWAFEVNTGDDVVVGLSSDGYETMAAAKRAVARVSRRAA